MEPSLNLLFDFNAILFLKENGIDVLSTGISPDSAGDPETFMLLAEAGLKHLEYDDEHPEVNREFVLKSLRGIATNTALKSIMEAYKRDVGSGEKDTNTDTETTSTNIPETRDTE